MEVILTCEYPTAGTCEEILAHPYCGSDLSKIREGMGVESYKDIKVDNIIILSNPQDNFLSSMDLEEVYTADDLDNLSQVAEFYDL